MSKLLRFRVISPFAIPHHCTADVMTKDGSLRITAGTTVFTNIHQILHDPQAGKLSYHNLTQRVIFLEITKFNQPKK